MNPIILNLTKFQIRGINGKYIRTESFALPDGNKQEIVVFSGEKSLFLGQCTPFKTIIIHEIIVNNERALNYVLLHEMAHKKQWWSFLFIPLVFTMIAGFMYLIPTFSFIFYSIHFQDFNYLIAFFVSLVLSLLLIILPWAFSWFMELNADFHAIKVIGINEYKDIMSNILKPRQLDLSSRIITRLTHPPVNMIIRCWNWYHRNHNIK